VEDELNAQECISEILRMSLLRIRLLGESGDAQACSLEADHVHNLPSLLTNFSWEALDYYYTTEVECYKSISKVSIEEFKLCWETIHRLLSTHKKDRT
jgi:hypothetical protein